MILAKISPGEKFPAKFHLVKNSLVTKPGRLFHPVKTPRVFFTRCNNRVRYQRLFHRVKRPRVIFIRKDVNMTPSATPMTPPATPRDSAVKKKATL